MLAALGARTGINSRNKCTYYLICISFVILFVISTEIIRGSVWYWLHELPLFSAIRAVPRIVLVMIFSLSFAAAIGVDWICQRYQWGTKAVFFIFFPFLLFEMSMVSVNATPKDVWRSQIAELERRLPLKIPQDSILFIAQEKEPYYANEVDAMILAMKLGIKTLNGYSGLTPPGFNQLYGVNCSELDIRIHSYLNFMNIYSKENYENLKKRIITIGFDNCNASEKMDLEPHAALLRYSK